MLSRDREGREQRAHEQNKQTQIRDQTRHLSKCSCSSSQTGFTALQQSTSRKINRAVSVVSDPFRGSSLASTYSPWLCWVPLSVSFQKLPIRRTTSRGRVNGRLNAAVRRVFVDGRWGFVVWRTKAYAAAEDWTLVAQDTCRITQQEQGTFENGNQYTSGVVRGYEVGSEKQDRLTLCRIPHCSFRSMKAQRPIYETTAAASRPAYCMRIFNFRKLNARLPRRRGHFALHITGSTNISARCSQHGVRIYPRLGVCTHHDIEIETRNAMNCCRCIDCVYHGGS